MNNKKNVWNNNFVKYDVLMIILLLVVIASMHLMMDVQIPLERGIDFYMPMMHLIFDVGIIFFVSTILTFKKRIATYILSFSICLIWGIVNVVYSRFFGQYIGWSVFESVGDNVSGSWWYDYVKMAFRWNDFIWIVLIVLLVLLVSKLRKSLSVEKKRNKGLFVVSILLVSATVVGYFMVVNPIISLIKTKGQNVSFVLQEDTFGAEFYRKSTLLPNTHIFSYGIVCGQVLGPLFSHKDFELTSEDVNYINSFIERMPPMNESDLMVGNSEKNVCFILLESFLSMVSELKIDGVEITPNLNSLRQQEGTYYNGMIKQNTQIGESSDGQLIYWTGLLPLKSEISINYIKKNHIDCLPKLLRDNAGYNTRIVLPTIRSFWSQNDLDKLYGIDEEVEALGNRVQNNKSFSTDSIVFEYAKQKLCGEGKRFDIVLSISTHSPYDDLKPECSGVSLKFHAHSFSREFQNYLTACRYMDYHIGRFIEEMKLQGVYDNTIFIIASDHAPRSCYLNLNDEVVNNYYLPLYIVNADIDLETAYYGIANQIDVFPTLLDLLQINSKWRGVGLSLMNRDQYMDVLDDNVEQMSEKIIRSNYFGKYK